MGALEWISQIAEWFGRFIPRLIIIRSTYSAIKWVRGKHVKVCPPGLMVVWPLVTEYVLYPIARQAEQLREQTLVSTDERTLVVGGMLIYEVEEIEKLVAHTHFPQQTVKDISLTVVHDVCCQMSWVALCKEQQKGTLDTKLKNEAAKALKPYGVKVVKLMLTDLSPCRVLRVVQTGKEETS